MSLIYSPLHENYGDDQLASLMALMDPELVTQPSTSYYSQAFEQSELSIKIPDFQHNYQIGEVQEIAHHNQESLELLDLIDQDILLEDINKLLDESEQLDLVNNSGMMDLQSGVSNDLAVMSMELPDSPPLDSSSMSCYAISSPSMDSYNEDSLNEPISETRRKSSGGRVGTAGRVCKKESNREAANRYRVKKQRERDELFAEVKF